MCKQFFPQKLSPKSWDIHLPPPPPPHHHYFPLNASLQTLLLPAPHTLVGVSGVQESRACAAAVALAALALLTQCPFLLCLSSALTCVGVLQESPQEEGGQEQRLQGGHGARSQEKISACGSLCSGESRVNSKAGGDLFNLFGDLAPPLIPSPTSFPRPVEFKEFKMIQQKSSLGMFVAFQRMGTPLGTEVGCVCPGAMTHFSFHRGHFLVPQIAELRRLHPQLAASLLRLANLLHVWHALGKG